MFDFSWNTAGEDETKGVKVTELKPEDELVLLTSAASVLWGGQETPPSARDLHVQLKAGLALPSSGSGLGPAPRPTMVFQRTSPFIHLCWDKYGKGVIAV